MSIRCLDNDKEYLVGLKWMDTDWISNFFQEKNFKGQIG